MSHAESSCRKKIIQTEITIRYLTSSRVIFTYRRISQRHTFCYLVVIVSGVRLPLRGRELTLSDAVWCHGTIFVTIRNPVRDDVRRTIILLQRSNISRRYRKAASSEVCGFSRCTIVRTLYYFTTESWELLYILSCPVATTCEKRVFFKNFKNNNHNLIKKYKLLHFYNLHFYKAFTNHFTVYRY